MTNTINIDIRDLEAGLADVLLQVEAGADFVITRAGRRVARIVPVTHDPSRGSARERVEESSAAYVASPAATLEGALAQLVSATATRRVLAIFLLNPAVEVHQREIARRSGVGLRSVQLAVKRLVAMGLLGERRDGNRLYYHAVRSDRFEQVRELLVRELGIAEVIARHLGKLSQPVSWAFVFGSAASGTDKIGSDIDLLVVTEASDDELVSPIAEAQRELGREIDLVSYRPDEFTRKREDGNHFISAVLRQPRVDVIGSDDDA